MQMWERAELKTRAKHVLKNSYWKAFLVALVLSFTGGGPNLGGSFHFPAKQRFNFSPGASDGTPFTGNTQTGMPHIESPTAVFDQLSDKAYIFLGIFAVIMILIILFAIAFSVFLTGPLEVSSKSYYTRAAQGDVNLGLLGFSFEKGRYFSVVKTMFFKNLYNFLWSLLLLVPGIIKALSYRMVPYLLSDNPFLDTERAITLSRELMDGQKFRAFVLDLSFIGWYLLGLIPLGLGIFFVNPYAFSTNAELYLVLREYGLQNGLCTYEELNLIRPGLAITE